MAALARGRLVKRTTQKFPSLFPLPSSTHTSVPTPVLYDIRTSLPVRDAELYYCRNSRSFSLLTPYWSPFLTNFQCQSQKDSESRNNNHCFSVGQRRLHVKPLSNGTVRKWAVTERNVTERKVTERPVTERNATERNITERNISERNVTERNISERNLTERNVTERNVTERNLTERNLTERNVTERNLTERAVVERKTETKGATFLQNGRIDSRKRVHLIVCRLQELQLSCNRFTCAQSLESALQNRFKRFCGSVSESNVVVILQHLQGNDFPLAFAFFQWAQKQPNFKLEKRTVSAIMRIAGRAKQFEVLENFLENFSTIAGEPADVITYTDVMKSYGDAYRFDDMMRMYARLIDEGLHPTVRTFSVLIRAFTRGRRPLEAMKYLRKMEEFNCKPNSFLYAEMIGMYGSMKQLRKAEALLEKMAAGGEPANRVIYNRLIAQCCYANDGDKAMSLLHQMIRIGLVPDSTTFSSLLDFFVKRDKKKEINILLEKAQSCEGVELNVYFYSVWMNMHIRRGEISEAERVFALMKSKGIKPSTVSYGTLLNGYAKKQLFEKVKYTVENMCVELGTINSSTYSVLVSYWLQATSDEDRKRVFECCEMTGYWWHNILVRLLQPPIENEVFQESLWVEIGDSLKKMLLEESSGADGLVMTVVAVLAKKKLEGRASRFWKEARTLGLLRGVSHSNSSMLTIDLHDLHPLASLSVLSSEFFSLWRDFQQGVVVPEYVQIITGWGRSISIEQAESLGVESRLKWQVVDILQQLNSPFVIPGDNEGRQVASSSEVKTWLEEDSTREALLLRDSALE